MNRLRQSNIPIVYNAGLYVAGMLLFLEWLYPVEQVTDTVYVGVFILYTFFCFFLSFLQVKWWLSWPLKGFGILFVLNGIFSSSSVLSKLWYHELYLDASFNIKMLVARQWFDLTNMFRTFLFLIVIWLMSYLIHYWFVQIKRVMIFSILTFVYITLLDTFTVYNANWAIIRTFVIVFLALGLANVFKEVQRENIHVSGVKYKALWVVPLIIVIVFSTMVGYAAPKLDPQWPDPLQYVNSAANGFGGAGGVIQKVGYGEDDSRLGGSFVQDYTPVFQAYVKDKSYFRIESKDLYTGKGWVSSERENYVEQMDGNITLKTFSDSTETKESEMTIEFDERAKIPKLLYPYGAKHVSTPNDKVELWLDEYTGEIKTEIENKDAMLDTYRITFDNPSYSIDQMRESGVPEDTKLLEKFTLLPNTVPQRVFDLAHEITDSYTNQYEKARAIERYFGGNGFEYQTTGVAVPEKNQDYVDQFLFETKVGYCDNFSTSMVVLLRALDIPARWVKGFTYGNKLEDDVNEEGYDLYEVTNSNAHSWVEVYFEGVGWVPFEPTQGFNVPNNYAIDLNKNDDALDAPKTQQPQKQDKQEKAQEAFKPSNGGKGFTFTFTWIHGAILGAIALMLLILAFWKRYQIQAFLLERKVMKRQDAAAYQDAYHFVLKVLKRKGFAKSPDQTLREYAKRIDNWFETDEMGVLTANYEKLIYQKNTAEPVNNNLSNLWKNLIKRILG